LLDRNEEAGIFDGLKQVTDIPGGVRNVLILALQDRLFQAEAETKGGSQGEKERPSPFAHLGGEVGKLLCVPLHTPFRDTEGIEPQIVQAIEGSSFRPSEARCQCREACLYRFGGRAYQIVTGIREEV